MALPIQGVADIYGGLSSDEKASITGHLQGLLPASWQDPSTQQTISVVSDTVSALSSLGPNAIHAVNTLASGNTVQGVEAALPVVAGAAALLPGPGTAIAGVIAAGGALFSFLASTFSWGQAQQQSCSWTVGQVCFHGNRPYGPTSPTWLKLDDFLSAGMDSHRTQLGRPAGQTSWEFAQGVADISKPWTWGMAAFPWYYSFIAQMYALGARGGVLEDNWNYISSHRGTQSVEGAFMSWWDARPIKDILAHYAKTNVGAFLLAYMRAFLASQEMLINGYKSPDPYALLVSVADAWNHGHASIAPLYSATSIKAQSPIGNQVFDGNSGQEYGNTFADMVIRGDIVVDQSVSTGQQNQPVGVNGGNPTIHITFPRGALAAIAGKTAKPTPKIIPLVIPPAAAHVPMVAPAVTLHRRTWVHWVPLALGVVAFPLTGSFVPPLVGAASSALWAEADRKGWKLPWRL